MSFTPGAGTRFLLFGSQPLSGGTISGNSSASFLDISGTWDTTGAPTGIKLNVTDTASNAASLLMDLRVGGVTQARITKAGSTLVSDISLWQNQTPGGSFGKVLWAGPNNTVILGRNGFEYAYVTGSGFGFPAGGTLGWGYSNSGGTADLILLRDAANTLAQRNGVNAQTLRVYRTFTDASNYERLEISSDATAHRIVGQRAGTGTNRSLFLEGGGNALGLGLSPSGALNWTINVGHLLTGTDNAYDIGASGASRPRNVFWAGYQEMSEMTAPAAPATNSVRIYAEDNGSGKTRLMALFATGVAQQIAIEP